MKKTDWSRLPYDAPQLCRLLTQQAGIRLRCGCGQPGCWITFEDAEDQVSTALLVRAWNEYLVKHAPPEDLAP